MFAWLWPFGRKDTPAAYPVPEPVKAPEPTPAPRGRKPRRKKGEAK